VMSGLTNAPGGGDSFNEAVPTLVTAAGAVGIKYANAGGDLAFTNDTAGLMSKVVAYDTDDLVKDGAEKSDGQRVLGYELDEYHVRLGLEEAYRELAKEVLERWRQAGDDHGG